MTKFETILLLLLLTVLGSGGQRQDTTVSTTKTTTSNNSTTTLITTTTHDNTTKSPTVGYIAAAVAVVFFGSNFVPVKSFETGDGMFFQWVFCVAIWISALILNAVQNFPTFYPINMIGGLLWATGNICVVPIVKTVGLGLGILLWGTTQMLIGWASGKFGWFGIQKEPIKDEALNYVGIALAAVSAVIFVFVKPAERNQQAHQTQTPVTEINRSSYEEIVSERDPLLPKVEAPSVNEPVPEPAKIFTDNLSSLHRRILGIALSVFSGIMYGFLFVPTLYIKQNYRQWYPTVSTRDIDHVFAVFSGILCASTLYFIIYCSVKKNKPDVYPSAILPALVSGAMWAVGMISYFLTNENLEAAIGIPIVSVGPGMIGSLWGVFFFREIQGLKNYIVLLIAFAFTIGSAIVTACSNA